MKTNLLRLTAASSSFVLAVAMGVAPPAAAAPPAPVVLSHMPAQDVDSLRRDVAQARAVDARPFAEVASIVALAPELNALARARRAPIALHIAKLGPGALMPALEMLALDPPRSVPAASARVVRRELVEAVGLLRDPRGLKVLSAIIEDTTEDFEMTRTASEAIARVGTDAAADLILGALAKTSGERARAIVAGMGECRRLRVTEAIAERLRNATDEATARAAIRSLGRSGNAWVWPTLSDHREEQQIRETAARALVDVFVRHEGDLRTAAANALMVVDAPRTPALITDARAAASSSPETVSALDALAARFARNPARVRPR